MIHPKGKPMCFAISKIKSEQIERKKKVQQWIPCLKPKTKGYIGFNRIEAKI